MTLILAAKFQYIIRQKLPLLILVIFLLSSSFLTPVAQAADTAKGAEIFSIHCAGCHINGGNIIRRGKTLKEKALKKYGMDSLEAMSDDKPLRVYASIVTNGKNNMSAYKDRLTSEQIQDVSAYVLEQAHNNWR